MLIAPLRLISRALRAASSLSDAEAPADSAKLMICNAGSSAEASKILENYMDDMEAREHEGAAARHARIASRRGRATPRGIVSSSLWPTPSRTIVRTTRSATVPAKRGGRGDLVSFVLSLGNPNL